MPLKIFCFCVNLPLHSTLQLCPDLLRWATINKMILWYSRSVSVTLVMIHDKKSLKNQYKQSLLLWCTIILKTMNINDQYWRMGSIENFAICIYMFIITQIKAIKYFTINICWHRVEPNPLLWYSCCHILLAYHRKITQNIKDYTYFYYSFWRFLSFTDLEVVQFWQDCNIHV